MQLHGISLEIPPGGLSEQMNIRLGIIHDKSHQPKLDDGKALLSQVVCWGPSGLRFERPAKLTLPHSARADGVEDVTEVWDFSVLMSKTGSYDETTWKETKLENWEGSVTVKGTHIIFDLDHFCKNVVAGKVQQDKGNVGWKKVSLMAYAPLPHPPDVFKVRVYCMSGDGNKQEAEVRFPLHPV